MVALIASIVWSLWHYTHRPQAFIRHWSERFRAIEHLDAARQVIRTEPVVLRILPSGEWLIATCEHSCCTGAGFDATVIRDSSGSIYTDTTHSFCGIEELGEELGESRKPAQSLESFYAALTQLKLQKQ